MERAPVAVQTPLPEIIILELANKTQLVEVPSNDQPFEPVVLSQKAKSEGSAAGSDKNADKDHHHMGVGFESEDNDSDNDNKDILGLIDEELEHETELLCE